jgi:chromosome segregation ATPase
MMSEEELKRTIAMQSVYIRQIEALKNSLVQCRANLQNAKDHILHLEARIRRDNAHTNKRIEDMENGK